MKNEPIQSPCSPKYLWISRITPFLPIMNPNSCHISNHFYQFNFKCLPIMAQSLTQLIQRIAPLLHLTPLGINGALPSTTTDPSQKYIISALEYLHDSWPLQKTKLPYSSSTSSAPFATQNLTYSLSRFFYSFS